MRSKQKKTKGWFSSSLWNPKQWGSKNHVNKIQAEKFNFLSTMGLDFSCLVVVDLAAKVHPAHVLNEDVHRVPLVSSDVYHQHSVSLQHTLENLPTQTHSWVKNIVSTCDVFPFYLTNIWSARQQKFIVKAYPIDGHICTVMNPIQWRDKWCWLWEVPGQRGPIKHVSIVLNTIDVTGCRHSRSSPCFKRFTVTTTLLFVAFRHTPYLFHLFKRQRILGCHWPEGRDGVQQIADVANLEKGVYYWDQS